MAKPIAYATRRRAQLAVLGALLAIALVVSMVVLVVAVAGGGA